MNVCVSCFAVRMRDVTDVMVRLHIGCDALVRGRARCNATSRTWGPVRRHSWTTRSASAAVTLNGLSSSSLSTQVRRAPISTAGCSQRGSVTTWVRAAVSARASMSSSTSGNGNEPWPKGQGSQGMGSLLSSAHVIG